MVTAINSMSEHKYTRHCLLANTTFLRKHLYREQLGLLYKRGFLLGVLAILYATVSKTGLIKAVKIIIF